MRRRSPWAKPTPRAVSPEAGRPRPRRSHSRRRPGACRRRRDRARPTRPRGCPRPRGADEAGAVPLRGGREGCLSAARRRRRDGALLCAGGVLVVGEVAAPEFGRDAVDQGGGVGERAEVAPGRQRRLGGRVASAPVLARCIGSRVVGGLAARLRSPASSDSDSELVAWSSSWPSPAITASPATAATTATAAAAAPSQRGAPAARRCRADARSATRSRSAPGSNAASAATTARSRAAGSGGGTCRSRSRAAASSATRAATAGSRRAAAAASSGSVPSSRPEARSSRRSSASVMGSWLDGRRRSSGSRGRRRAGRGPGRCGNGRCPAGCRGPGDLGVVEVAQVAQDDRHPELVRQAGQGGVDVQPPGHGLDAGVGDVDDPGAGTVAPPSAAVEGGDPGTGRRARRRSSSRQALLITRYDQVVNADRPSKRRRPRAMRDQRLLECVLGVGLVAGQPPAQAPPAVVVAAQQRVERGPVAGLGGGDERAVVGFGVRWGEQ